MTLESLEGSVELISKLLELAELAELEVSGSIDDTEADTEADRETEDSRSEIASTGSVEIAGTLEISIGMMDMMELVLSPKSVEPEGSINSSVTDADELSTASLLCEEAKDVSEQSGQTVETSATEELTYGGK